MTNNTEYMGDGVYATFDGYGLQLRVNDHRSPVAVYLEPDVLEKINAFYAQKMRRRNGHEKAMGN